MKIAIYSDNHFQQYSSIVRDRGDKYSVRLENQIQSINWVEHIAKLQNCDQVVCAGDFFDKDTLNQEELTQLSDIEWSDLRHYFLVGNHELGVKSLVYNSANIFRQHNFKVVSEPFRFIAGDSSDVLFLPYIQEEDRKPLDEYYHRVPFRKTVIISHNDIQGIQMGQFVSKCGFSIDDIEQNCDLFINGHIHNGSFITPKIINIGNLTGQNFSEDASMYHHQCMVLDTETLAYTIYDNPNQLNFFKIDYKGGMDISHLNDQNAVVSFTVSEEDYDALKDSIKDMNIIKSRVTVTYKAQTLEDNEQIRDLKIDHIQQFMDYVQKNIGTNDIIQQELERICK